MYQSIRQQDEKLGIDAENELNPILNTFFDCDFKTDANMYAPYDFIDTDKKVVIELKTRRISSQAFLTILIGWNKYEVMKKFKEQGYDAYFVFKLTDGIFYWSVPDDLPNDCEKRELINNRRGGIKSNTLHIPTNLLIKMKI